MPSETAIILAIETSCDETAVAIGVLDGAEFQITTELVSSQIAVHRAYGGVVPEVAAREHLAILPLMVEEALAKLAPAESAITHIAATTGPGLLGCLLIGATYGKGLALARSVPFLGINHIEGHLLSAMLNSSTASTNADHLAPLTPPYICLVASGGHTEIHVVHDFGNYELLMRTRDDAAGEAFDKCAHLLGFPYPGGPQLASLADSRISAVGVGSSADFKLPQIMPKAMEISFSGFKTAVAQKIRALGDDLTKDQELRADLAVAIQDGIVGALVTRVASLVEKTGINKISISGGVAANNYLREKLVAKIPAGRFFFPHRKHCVDNAAMIALVASKKIERGLMGDSLNSEVNPRSRAGESES